MNEGTRRWIDLFDRSIFKLKSDNLVDIEDDRIIGNPFDTFFFYIYKLVPWALRKHRIQGVNPILFWSLLYLNIN